jgi:hypothetical protein
VDNTPIQECNIGQGICVNGTCVTPPKVGTCDDTAAWNAQPKTCAIGKEFDATAASCTCQIAAGAVIGGGICDGGQNSIVSGCEVPSTTLMNQLAIDAYAYVNVVGNGTTSVAHSARLVAFNPNLPIAAGLVGVDAASIFTDTDGGFPAQLENSLDPALAGLPLSFFTGGGEILDLKDPQIEDATTTYTPPLSVTSVDFNFDDILLLLTIISTGAPLPVTTDTCIFDNPGTILGECETPAGLACADNRPTWCNGTCTAPPANVGNACTDPGGAVGRIECDTDPGVSNDGVCGPRNCVGAGLVTSVLPPANGLAFTCPVE